MNFLRELTFFPTSQSGASPCVSFARNPRCFLSSTTIRTLIFQAVEAQKTRPRGPRGLLAGKNPAAMQIHGRSAFSKFVAPWAGTRVLHSSCTSYVAASGQYEIPGSGCSDASSLLFSTFAPLYVLLSRWRVRRVWPSFTHSGHRDAQEGCRCAIIFAWFRSVDQIKTADGTQRRVRLRSALRSKTEFPESGPIRATMRRDAGDGTIPGPNLVATPGQRRKQMKKSEREDGGSCSDVCRSLAIVFVQGASTLTSMPLHVPVINEVMNDIEQKLAARSVARMIIEVIKVFGERVSQLLGSN